jgi:hypothetical protein
MATTNLVVYINTPTSSNDLISGMAHAPNKTSPSEFMHHLGTLITARAQVGIQLLNGNSGAASGTVTLTNASISANDTITVGGITFTAKASGASGNQFNIGGTATITATNLAAAVNASTGIDHTVFYATSAAGVVTFQMVSPGTYGNHMSLATSNGAGFGLSGSTFTGGANDTASVISFTKGR